MILDAKQLENVISFIDKEINETQELLEERDYSYHDTEESWNEFTEMVNKRIQYLEDIKTRMTSNTKYELRPEIINVYDYNDVIGFICSEMNIPTDKFRKYHEIVGSSDEILYKDFWHIWLDCFDVQNDISKNTFLSSALDLEEEILQQRGQWTEPFFRAIEKLIHEVGEEITIKYSW